MINSRIYQLLADFKKEDPLGESEFEELKSSLPINLDEGYLKFIKESNGGEGFVGDGGYLSLWKMENLVDWNKDYEVPQNAPGYFFFASDGGGEAYAFNIKDGSFVKFAFIGMLIVDEPVLLGSTFLEFLESLASEQQ